MEWTGGCLCGSVRYRASQAPDYARYSTAQCAAKSPARRLRGTLNSRKPSLNGLQGNPANTDRPKGDQALLRHVRQFADMRARSEKHAPKCLGGLDPRVGTLGLLLLEAMPQQCQIRINRAARQKRRANIRFKPNGCSLSNATPTPRRNSPGSSWPMDCRPLRDPLAARAAARSSDIW